MSKLKDFVDSGKYEKPTFMDIAEVGLNIDYEKRNDS